MTDYILPGLLLVISLAALRKGENGYNIMLTGCRQGLEITVSILPALILLLTAISMFRASGALDQFSRMLAPLLHKLGIPPETAVLILIRPLSGSGALAVGAELMAAYGPDSSIGLTTAVMLGSTETTFYTISVYFGAAGVEKTRYTVPAALIAVCVGFLTAAWTVRWFNL